MAPNLVNVNGSKSANKLFSEALQTSCDRVIFAITFELPSSYPLLITILSLVEVALLFSIHILSSLSRARIIARSLRD